MTVARLLRHLRPARGLAAVARTAGLVSFTVLFTGCLFGGKRVKKGTAPEFYGRVVNVQGKDTVAVANAKVWTTPFSQDVSTDSSGYFSISSGLVPGGYKVFAEARGVKGQTETVPAEIGKSKEVFIMLGEEETAWPPNRVFDMLKIKLTKGKGEVRIPPT